jgi:hypothetical protein
MLAAGIASNDFDFPTHRKDADLDEISKELISHRVHLLHLFKLFSKTQAEGLELQVSVLAT